jgi:hypothetical protein
MARFRKMRIAPGVPAETTGQPGEIDEAAQAVARASVKPLPEPAGSDDDRLGRLLAIEVEAADRELGRAAVEAAARLQVLTRRLKPEPDRKAAGMVARYLLWRAFGDVIDPARALTRDNVDEYLVARGDRGQNLRQLRYVLYRVGRVLHPREFPLTNSVPAPRLPRHQAARPQEIRAVQVLIADLPDPLSQRAQALLDLAYGAGVRAADFKTLRGTAIRSVQDGNATVSVVTLPNRCGGVRQVPVVAPAISARLRALAARVGDRLILAPHTEKPEKNLVNRVSEALRCRGHPGMDPLALRNRWILDLAARVPAALLVQLADVADLRVLGDQRKLLPHYETNQMITILKENQK